MNNNELLSGENDIVKQISKLQNELAEENKKIAQAENTKEVSAYLESVRESKKLEDKISLLRAELVARCQHIRVIWKEEKSGKIEFHITCAVGCGYKEDSKDYKNAAYEGKLPSSIVPHVFNSYEEAVNIYKQAIQLVSINDKAAIIKKMGELAQLPMVKEPGKQRVLVPMPKPIPVGH